VSPSTNPPAETFEVAFGAALPQETGRSAASRASRPLQR